MPRLSQSAAEDISFCGMFNRLSAVARCRGPAGAGRPAAQTKRALTLDDHSRIVSVGDPQRSPDGVWVAYTVTHHRRREGSAQHRRLDGEVGRQRAAAADLVARQRVVAALESRQQVPRVRRVARHRRREEEGRADLAAQSRRRRSAEGQRLQGRRRPTSSGRPTARASRSWPTIRIRPTSPRSSKAGSARPRRRS